MKRTKERIVLELNNSINEIEIHKNKLIDLEKELIQFAKFKVGQKVLVCDIRIKNGKEEVTRTEAFVYYIQVGGHFSSEPKDQFFYRLKKVKKDQTQSEHNFSYYPIIESSIQEIK